MRGHTCGRGASAPCKVQIKRFFDLCTGLKPRAHRRIKQFILAGVAGLAIQAPPAAPTRWVTDTANFISPATVTALDARLQAYQQATGHQLLVYIADSTNGVPIEDFAVRTFESWRVGRQGVDDGLVLFIMAKDRRLRIEVGYGLEGQVPDAIASRIVNEVIVPRVQANDPDGAVVAGMEAAVSVISGQGLGAFGGAAQGGEQQGARQARPLTLAQLVFYGIIGIVFLIILATNPSLAIYLLASMLSSGGRRGGGGFGGGGFQGGGGRSGGGGASGSW